MIENGSGINAGGKTLALPSNINEAASIHTNGTRVIREVIIKNVYRNIFFILYSSAI
jgi:hypothetical protein